MSAVPKSMYQRLLSDLEAAVNVAANYKYILNKQDYPRDEDDDKDIARCLQTIKAGKAFVALMKGED